MENNNIQNPFIGLRTYEESDAVLFRGRKSSTSDLYSLISENDVVVLHAESGEGKSSLLNAGLFPMLRDERFFPIKISFTEEDYALENPNFDRIVYQRIVDCVNQINGDTPDTQVFRDAPSLDGKITITPIIGIDTKLSHNNDLRQCSWWLLRDFTLNAYGASLIPVLVFDQFEEVFTRPKSNTWTEDFFIWLSRTLDNTVPQNVIDQIREIIGSDTEFPQIGSDKKFKALFSLRTEYMGELDYWGIQRHHITVLKNSRYCLKPLTEHEADEVLELQPIFTPQIREQIKRAIRSSNGSKRIQSDLPTIPAMLLSVVSTTATNNIVKKGTAFDSLTDISDKGLSTDIFTNIIDQFYQKEITDANIPKRVTKQIENVLVDDKGKRVRIKADSKELRRFDFEEKYKPILQQKRLIKCTQINGDEYIELTHDALAKVIVKRRDTKLQDKSRWTNYILNSSYCLIVLLAIVYWFSFLAKDYIYGGYDAMREYHYVTTNLFKKIIISFGFFSIGYLAFRRLNKTTSPRKKVVISIVSYVFISIFYFVAKDIIEYLDYPGIRLKRLSPADYGIIYEDLLFKSIFIVGSTLFFGVGCFFSQWKRYIKSFRWPLLIGIPLIVGALSPYIYAISPVISYLMITFALFYCVSSVLKKEKYTCLLLLIAIGLIILAVFLYCPYGNLPKYCVISILTIILGYFFYFLVSERGRSFFAIFKILPNINGIRRNRLISSLYGLYNISIIGFLCFALGYKLNDIYSLIGLIVACTLMIYIISRYIIPIKIRAEQYILYAVCLLSVIAIWCIQYTYLHFWATIFIWLLGIIVVIFLSSKFSVQNHNKNVKTLLKIYSNSVIIYFLVVGFMPFLLLGYNIMALNYSSKVYNRTVYIRDVDAKLIFIRDNDDKLGLIDRRGKIIIPTNYNQIITDYDTTYDNLWDDNYKTKTQFYGFILIEDWQISEWCLAAHVKNGKLIPNSEWFANQDDLTREQFIDTSIEENRIKNQIVRLVKANNKEISAQTDWRFNHKDVTHLELLNNINFDSIAPNLSATSASFQKCYLDTILPNLNFDGYGLVSNVLSHEYNWDDIIDKNSLEAEYSDKITNIISDNVTGRMLVQRELAKRLTNLATTFANGGRLSVAEFLSYLSFTKGKYDDAGKALYIKVLLDQNKIEDAVIFIKQKENELYNETSWIFPEEEYSWIHIRYTPLIRHLPSKYQKKIMDHGYKFEIKGMLPFDMIQLLPDSINGDMYRYFHTFPVPNGFSRTYSYFVKDGKRVTPPLSFWSISTNNGDPILAINCITKKRQFIKSNDILGYAYTIEEINEDEHLSFPPQIYSHKYLNHILEENPGKYKITKSYRYSGEHPSTFISPKLIKGEYDHAWPFSEGLAAVEINGKIGFINTEGDIVIEPKYKSPFNFVKGFLGDFYKIYSTGKFYNPYFRNGVCPVYDELGNLIWIDKDGKMDDAPTELPTKGIL